MRGKRQPRRNGVPTGTRRERRKGNKGGSKEKRLRRKGRKAGKRSQMLKREDE